MTEDEVVGWHHRLNGYEFEQTPGDDKGQGSLQSMGSQRVGHDLVTEQHLKSINGPSLSLLAGQCGWTGKSFSPGGRGPAYPSVI